MASAVSASAALAGPGRAGASSEPPVLGATAEAGCELPRFPAGLGREVLVERPRGAAEVIEALRDGGRIADRHRVTVTKRDGTNSQLEVYLFGELAKDGHLRRVDEISRVIAGDEADSVLADQITRATLT